MAQFEKAFSDRAASALSAWVRRDSHGMFATDTKASVRRIGLWAICAITLMGLTIRADRSGTPELPELLNSIRSMQIVGSGLRRPSYIWAARPVRSG